MSFDPLLCAIPDADLLGIQWAIVGGESGPGYRHMQEQWARSLRDSCVRQGVAFFMKQNSDYRPELRPWLIEEDGSQWQWHQFPHDMSAPVRLP